jgi:hypothetical protein
MDSSGSTIYTASNTVLVKSITVCNYTNAAVWFTIALAGTNIVYHHNIAAYNTITVPCIDQFILNGETITAQSSAATCVTYYVSGATGV